jgi:hypothetical protein
MQLNVLELKWNKNEIDFNKNTRKYIQILFKFHFEMMVHSIGFILNWIQNLRIFGIIKVGNKYFWIWLVNMVFKSIFSIEIWMK